MMFNKPQILTIKIRIKTKKINNCRILMPHFLTMKLHFFKARPSLKTILSIKMTKNKPKTMKFKLKLSIFQLRIRKTKFKGQMMDFQCLILQCWIHNTKKEKKSQMICKRLMVMKDKFLTQQKTIPMKQKMILILLSTSKPHKTMIQ